MRKHDLVILEKMLKEPKYAKETESMTSQELARYKILLVGRGEYSVYAKGLEAPKKKETKKAE